MTVQTVWAAWFSATDTTRAVVNRIAARLARQTGAPLETYDFTLPQARKAPRTFGPGDLVVLGTPVYAGRVPNLLIPFISSLRGSGALAVPVVCYGNRAYDDALMELKAGPKRDAYLDSIRPRLSPDSYNAAVSRLDDVIAHAEKLKDEGRIVQGDAWQNVRERPLQTGNVTVQNRDGQGKSIGGSVAKIINQLYCPSYFARDDLSKILE